MAQVGVNWESADDLQLMLTQQAFTPLQTTETLVELIMENFPEVSELNISVQQILALYGSGKSERLGLIKAGKEALRCHLTWEISL